MPHPQPSAAWATVEMKANAAILPGGMSVADAHDICDRLESALQSEFEDARVTIHVEPENMIKHTGVLVLSP
jgi:divalent metal cation (Fe/Co/Zn/Cd) transporter